MLALRRLSHVALLCCSLEAICAGGDVEGCRELYPGGPLDQKVLDNARHVIFLVPYNSPGYDPDDPDTWIRPTDRDMFRISQAAPKLEGLELEGGAITEVGVRHLGKLKHLSRLTVRRATMGNNLVKEISKFPSIQELHLPGCNLSNEAAQFLAKMKGLSVLTLRGCSIDDAFLDEYELPRNLKVLDLSETPVACRVVANLPPALKELQISESNVKIECLSGLRSLHDLKALKIDSPHLTSGSIQRLGEQMPGLYINGRVYNRDNGPEE